MNKYILTDRILKMLILFECLYNFFLILQNDLKAIFVTNIEYKDCNRKM